jgi:ribonuclease HI
MNVTIIADASYGPDTRGAGYGFWIASERGKRPGGGPIKRQVDGSGAAEMMAICNAVKEALRFELVHPGDKLLLQTDCESAIMAFQNQRQNLTRDEAEAKRVFWETIKGHNLTFFFKHVKGHMTKAKLRHMGITNGARYVTNNMCDMRAREGMLAARERYRGQ